MKKNLVFALFLLLTISACQTERHELHDDAVRYGSISVSPVVLTTRAENTFDADAVKASMMVYVIGEGVNESYPYTAITGPIQVPANSVTPYYVAAQSCSEDEALRYPDEWGQPRYAGVAEVMVEKIETRIETVDEENPEAEPVVTFEPYVYDVKVPCTVANSLVSVTFDSTISTYYSDYSVTAYTDDNRRLVFNADNAESAVAYFTAGKLLYFEFAGVFNVTGESETLMKGLELSAAEHYVLNFKMRNTTGSLDRPTLNVDVRCEDIYENVTIDPSDDGTVEKGNDDEE